MRRFIALSSLIAITACAQPLEGRVASRLTDAGIPRGMAQCMAERWVDRLSLLQLRKIQSLTSDIKRDRGEGRLTVFRLVDRIRQVDDEEIFNVVSKSAAHCALKV
jgi:hypothetical protein